MSDPNTPDAPLSPEMNAIMARARRSFMVTMGLLLVGFIIIAGVLVYRSSQGKAGGTGADYVIAAMKIPSGAQVVSAVAADGKVTVTYKTGAMTSVRIYDGKTGEMIREIPILSE